MQNRWDEGSRCCFYNLLCWSVRLKRYLLKLAVVGSLMAGIVSLKMFFTENVLLGLWLCYLLWDSSCLGECSAGTLIGVFATQFNDPAFSFSTFLAVNFCVWTLWCVSGRLWQKLQNCGEAAVWLLCISWVSRFQIFPINHSTCFLLNPLLREWFSVVFHKGLTNQCFTGKLWDLLGYFNAFLWLGRGVSSLLLLLYGQSPGRGLPHARLKVRLGPGGAGTALHYFKLVPRRVLSLVPLFSVCTPLSGPSPFGYFRCFKSNLRFGGL